MTVNKLIIIIVAVFSIFIFSPLYADECMEGDCDNGFGTGFTDDNKIYEGEWLDGMPHGHGTLYLSKGKVVQGRWEKGELVKEEPVIEKKPKDSKGK